MKLSLVILSTLSLLSSISHAEQKTFPKKHAVIQVNNMEVEFNRFLDGDQTVVEFGVMACMTDVATGQRLDGIKIDIEINRDDSFTSQAGLSDTKITKAVNQYGCINFVDQARLPMDISKLSDEEKKQTGLKYTIFPAYKIAPLPDSSLINREVTMMINPIDTKYTFGRDVRQLNSTILLKLLRKH